MKEKMAAMRAELDKAEQDVSLFEDGGNKSAGARARKALQNIKKLAQEVRVAIQDAKTAAKAGK